MAIQKGAVLLLALSATAYANVALSDFFPYGPNVGDARVPTADDNFVNVTMLPGHVFHFFHNSYTDFFLNNNGGVSFLRGAPEFTPTCGPLNTPMIMPYWADVNTVLGGNVYYRQTTDSQMIQKARDECSRAFPGLNTQNINWMFLATWENVPFFGAQPANGTCEGLNARNNFQLALVTDGNMSFAMFFYNTITWTTGTASGGDCNGQNGTPAKAGFDVGDGVNFFTLPGTCTSQIRDVTGTSNVEQNGKWIFRIDQGFVDPGVPEEAATNYPAEGSAPATQTPPIVAGSECDPNMCELVGHCTTYFTCDPVSRRRVSWECSEGLFWNPKKPKMPSYATTWQPMSTSTPGYWGSSPTGYTYPAGTAPAGGNTAWPENYWNYSTNYAATPPGPAYPAAAAGRQYSPYASTYAPYTSPAYAPAPAPYTSPAYAPAPAPYPYTSPAYAPAPAPYTSPVEMSTNLPEEECHGSCDVWENLPEDVKAMYHSDEQCFPKCYYASLGPCSPYYLFHSHNEERRHVEVLECPVDTRNGMRVPLVWVQERESCDFCYNAMTQTYGASTTSGYDYYTTSAPYYYTTSAPSTAPMWSAPAGRSLGSPKQWGYMNSTAPAATYASSPPYYGPEYQMSTCCAKYDYDLIPAPMMVAVPTLGRSLNGGDKGKVVVPKSTEFNFDLKHKG